MRLIALLGNPVEHSLSPRFQNAAIRALGFDAEYRAIRCEASEVPGLIREITSAGGGGNVTLPHKEIAAAAVERATEAVQQTGACNTFWSESGLIHGDNTDIPGFTTALARLLGRSPAGMRVLLIGAGGAARAVAFALAQERASDVVVLNRSLDRARDLADSFSTPATSFSIHQSADLLRGETFDLVVNATSLGLKPGDASPLSPDMEIRPKAAFDLVYRPDETEWVRAWRAEGIPAVDGLEMLLQQGAAAFERWWGVPAPIDAMRAAVAR
ncbi:MAG: shikimate dehydrogenase [Gemmatimonadota bacterium]|jgi:shikimate dehydrogenase|nr:shikimate dehydrogenase [Gemmatimonadota bacterium]